MMSSPIGPANKRLKFSIHKANYRADVPSKVAALKVSKSIVSLVSYSGDEQVFECSGTIIESDTTYAIVLTSAYLLRWPSHSYSIGPNIKVVVHTVNNESFDGHVMACDFHYHIAAIKINTKTRLPPATLRFLNDSLAVDTSRIPMLLDRNSFELRPHSDSFDVIPGSSVICVGRYFKKPYELMAAPGVFSLGTL